MSCFSILRLYLVLPDGAVPRSWQPAGRDLLFASALVWEWCTWEGSEVRSWTFPCFVFRTPMLMECKGCIWGQCTQPALVSVVAWGERQRGVKPMMPALEFRRQIFRSCRQSKHTWAGLHHSPTLGPQEVAQAWVAPAVLTLFNNDLSYQCCHDFGQSPLWIILLNYGWMSAAETYYP